MENVAGIILAGGRASRMGGHDKALTELGGRPLLLHVANRLAPQVAPIAVNANGDAGRLAGFGLPVIPDDDEDFLGPLAGILAGLRWAATLDLPPDSLATIAVDTPFFPVDLVARLRSAQTRADMIVLAATHGRRHPTFGLWPLETLPRLAAHMEEGGSLKVADFVDTLPNAVVDFNAAGGHDPFFNVNTPDDLAEAERILRG